MRWARLSPALGWRELFRDFHLGLNIFDQYDSKPPQTGAEKNDVSVTTSIGYKW